MKKKGLVIGMALSLVVCLCLALFCACGTETNGKDGADGKSAYDIWLENGHSGTESDFLEWLKGSSGSSGQNGTNGQNGKDGEDGKDGVDGQDGKDGKDGVNGKDGVDGQDGKDGLSAYELFMKYYPFYQGTEKDWVDALINDNLKLFTVTFKMDEEEDIVRYAFKGQAVLEIPEVPAKIGNSGVWDTADFSSITEDLTVNAVYETEGLAYTLCNDQQEYRVSAGTMDKEIEELFIPATHEGKPVTVIAENAFQGGPSSGYYNFKAVHLPKSIREIRKFAFNYCRQLQSIQIPSSVTAIADAAFAGCFSLTTVEMPQVTTIGEGAFWGCESLMTAEMPNVTSIDFQAFFDCTSLMTVEMPNVTYIGSDTFWNCTSLTAVDMPNVTYIGSYVFSGCTSLEHLEIPDGVTTISYHLFEYCPSLKYVILPSEITSIGNDVLEGCTVFEAVYFKGSKEAWSGIKIGESNRILSDAKVYCYADHMPGENEGDYWHYDADNKTPVVWKKQS